MTDYSKTKQASSNRIAERFAQTFRNLQDDFEEDIVVISLINYYEIVDKEEDKDLLWAIERVLQDYMTYEDYNAWIITAKGKENNE